MSQFAAGDSSQPRREIERLIVSEGITYSLVEMGQQAVNVLLLPVSFFFLSFEEFGVITWALVISQIAMLLSTLGLDFSVLRLYYVWAADRRIGLASGVWIVCLMWSLLIAGAASGIIATTSASDLLKWSLLLGVWSGVVLGLRNILLSLVRVTGDMRMYATAELSAAILRGGCQIALIATGFGATGYMAGYLLGSAASMLLLLSSATCCICWRGALWRLDQRTWRYTWDVLPSIAITRVMAVADRIVLFQWANIDVLGVYGAASRFTASLKFVSGGFKLAFAPLFSRAEADKIDLGRVFSQLSRLMLLAMLICGTAVMLAAWSVQFTPWGIRSNELGQLVGVLLLAQFLSAVAAMGQLKLCYSATPRHAGFVAAANAAALAVGVVLLVPAAGALGAAFAQMLASAIGVGIIAAIDVRATRRFAPWHQLLALTAFFTPALVATWIQDSTWQLYVFLPTLAFYSLIAVSTIHQLREPILRHFLRQ